MKHSLNCDINVTVGGHHEHCDCECHTHCPNCPDQGWYIVADNSGEPEQVQCEWCYTVPNSVFNQTLDKGD
jgi:hypothetical protein